MLVKALLHTIWEKRVQDDIICMEGRKTKRGSSQYRTLILLANFFVYHVCSVLAQKVLRWGHTNIIFFLNTYSKLN